MIYRKKSIKPKNMKASKTKTNMKNIIRGCIFCGLWYLSIITGFFLLICPLLPLVVISPKKYRKWSDLVFGIWEPFPVAMMEVCFGVRIVLSGDKINPFEGSLFIMNHRTRVDWSFLWMGLFHCSQPNAHNIKYILKAPIMHIPALGWVMQACSFIFLYRNWAKDKPLLDRIIDYLNESDSLYQILLFPEGTDLTENTLRKSHKYADEHNLDRYYQVLHPRSTGFVFIVDKMKSVGQLKAIYDVTIAYPKTMPCTETDLLRGKFPEEVHFHVKRYSSSNIPFEEEDLKSWLCKIWREKEIKLQKFYSTGSFTNCTQRDGPLHGFSDQEVDFGKTSMKNGIIKYDLTDEEPNNESLIRVTRSAMSVQPHSSSAPDDRLSINDSKTYVSDHVNCEEVYRSKNYRPAHLLYLVLAFWIFLIIFAIHQFCFNFYAQIWILTHSLLFTAFSFVSNGFHHVVASIFFYKHERRPVLLKKSE